MTTRIEIEKGIGTLDAILVAHGSPGSYVPDRSQKYLRNKDGENEMDAALKRAMLPTGTWNDDRIEYTILRARYKTEEGIIEISFNAFEMLGKPRKAKFSEVYEPVID